ncbi:MAG: NADH-quinone oxidoreductase subunit L, partial [Alphaproteobacteria bacterium]|nr:NADH-quinone oxidoreductase subunit L [Alphaproteobacteria bacterium]
MLLYAAPVFLPLIGAAITGLFGRFLGDRPSQLISCGAMGLAALASILVFNNVVMQGEVQQIFLFNWMTSGSFQVDWALRIDELTAMMVFTVS